MIFTPDRAILVWQARKYQAPNGEGYVTIRLLARRYSIFSSRGISITLARAGVAVDCRAVGHVTLVQRLSRGPGPHQGMAPGRVGGELVYAFSSNRLRNGHAFERAVQSSGHHQSAASVHYHSDCRRDR